MLPFSAYEQSCAHVFACICVAAIVGSKSQPVKPQTNRSRPSFVGTGYSFDQVYNGRVLDEVNALRIVFYYNTDERRLTPKLYLLGKFQDTG